MGLAFKVGPSIGRGPARVHALGQPDQGAGHVLERERRVRVQPALELADRDQSATATTHHAQLVHDVLLEEVDAETQGVGRLALGECEATKQASARLRCVVLECPPYGHATTSDQLSCPHPLPCCRLPVWEICGAVSTPLERF